MALETDTGTQTAFAVIAGVAAILVGFVVLIFYFIRDKGMMREIVEMQRRFDTFKTELQTEHQKKMFKYSKGTQEFLKQYKKPILQSAFDLQSRLTNQVKNNFLYSFLQERGGERDQNYALYNFSFVFAEFLGWLEVIRQELVFITGDAESVQLASLIEGIKFQLTGETPVQGTAPKGQEDNPEFEADSRIFQLYAGELRSIGSVMIHTDVDAHKSIINADEFQRLMTVPAPSKGASNEQARMEWARSRERLFQDMLLPLFGHLRTMAMLPKGQAPIRRLAILQVLLAKLIDMVDNAVPWETGPKFDVGEEPQYITRDFRLTPLVAYLNSFQRKWLAVQPFMENADKVVSDPIWEDHMKGREEYWPKLCFAGFREDLASLPQDVRDKKPDMWPGACPPRQHRQRPEHYIERRAPAGPIKPAALHQRNPTQAGSGPSTSGALSPKPALPSAATTKTPTAPAVSPAGGSPPAAPGGAVALVVRPPSIPPSSATAPAGGRPGSGGPAVNHAAERASEAQTSKVVAQTSKVTTLPELPGAGKASAAAVQASGTSTSALGAGMNINSGHTHTTVEHLPPISGPHSSVGSVADNQEAIRQGEGLAAEQHHQQHQQVDGDDDRPSRQVQQVRQSSVTSTSGGVTRTSHGRAKAHGSGSGNNPPPSG